MPTEKEYIEFDERIYSKLNALEKTILAAATLADWFSIDFAVSVSQSDDAPQVVKDLLKKSLLVKKENAFSISSTFSDYIGNEVQYLNWNERNQIIRRAIGFWSKSGAHEQAISFCCKHRFWDLATDVLLGCSDSFVSAGQFEKLHKWFEQVPAEYIDKDPLLMVYRAWCFPEFQKINGAEPYLRQVDLLLENNKLELERSHWLKASVQALALKGYISRISGDYQQAVVHAQRAVSLASEGYPAILSRLYTTIGQDLYLKGDALAAQAALQQAMSLGKQYKKHHDVLIALGYSVASMLLSGQLSAAITLYEDTLTWFENTGVIDHSALEMLNDLPIDVYREMFDVDKAESYSAKMLAYCENTAPALHHLTTHMRRYRMAMNVDSAEQAYVALTQAESFREILGVSWAFGWLPVNVMRIEYELRFGDVNVANRYFETREAELNSNNSFANENERFVLAEWLAKVGRYQDACKQLQDIKSQALREHRVLHAIRAEVQIAVTLYPHDTVSAVLHLRDALQLVPEKENIVGPFLWYGDVIMPLLEKVGAKLYQDPCSLVLFKAIKAKAEQCWPSIQTDDLLKQLSGRQMMIMKLLIEGDQDKVIAKKLGISPGTVKTHLRAIYRKLNCNNRAQAVSVAMENGMLYLDDVMIG